jgi:hypothetical protein
VQPKAFVLGCLATRSPGVASAMVSKDTASIKRHGDVSQLEVSNSQCFRVSLRRGKVAGRRVRD